MSGFRILAVLFALNTLVFCDVADKFVDFFKGEKCMGELGCFDIGPPFYDPVERPVSLFPYDRDVINTRFYLHTEKSGRHSTRFSNLDDSIKYLNSSGFNPRIKTKFLISGFLSERIAYWKIPLVQLLLHAGDYNVFLVDWDAGDGLPYAQAVANTRVAGAEIALFIQRIKKITNFHLSSVHLIGHSLGCHVAGYAGKRLNKIGYITALDPAGPYYTKVDKVVRLDRGDARFVDAIHTDAGPNLVEGFGTTESIAHIDFWPNGGYRQPDCPNSPIDIMAFLLDPMFDIGDDRELLCNHDRAIDLFLSSIRYSRDYKLVGPVCDSYDDYKAGKCESNKKIVFGLHTNYYSKYIESSKSLDVYFKTNSTFPFYSF